MLHLLLLSGGYLPTLRTGNIQRASAPARSSVKAAVGVGLADDAETSPRVGQFGFPEPGPMPLVEERDACGVGFLADTKGRRRHDTISRALHALSCMEHRGGCGGDSVSGDGAGVMTAVPWELYEEEGWLKGKPSESCGVGMMFLPQKEEDALAAQKLLEDQVKAQGYEFLGWRDVPQNKLILGELALAALPTIRQAFIHHPTLRGDELESGFYQLKRSTQGDVTAVGGDIAEWTYFVSMSTRTIVHKGMVMSCILGPFYRDLMNPSFKTNFAIYHRRFSTNTNPKWPLAQPFRCLAHNGEINTLIGNVNWQRALDIKRARRIGVLADAQQLGNTTPCLRTSDSTRRRLSLSILVPGAYRDQPAYNDHPEIVDMFEYYAGMRNSRTSPFSPPRRASITAQPRPKQAWYSQELPLTPVPSPIPLSYVCRSRGTAPPSSSSATASNWARSSTVTDCAPRASCRRRTA